jgi:hypothetical protein
MIARLESCAPMLSAVKSEEDADLVAEERSASTSRACTRPGAGTDD